MLRKCEVRERGGGNLHHPSGGPAPVAVVPVKSFGLDDEGRIPNSILEGCS